MKQQVKIIDTTNDEKQRAVCLYQPYPAGTAVTATQPPRTAPSLKQAAAIAKFHWLSLEVWPLSHFQTIIKGKNPSEMDTKFFLLIWKLSGKSDGWITVFKNSFGWWATKLHFTVSGQISTDRRPEIFPKIQLSHGDTPGFHVVKKSTV